MCARYGPAAPTTSILSCVWSATVPNQRTVTCQLGFWAMGPGQDESKNSVVLTGAVTFAGCKRMLTFFSQKKKTKKKSKLRKLLNIFSDFFLEIDDCLVYGMGPSPPTGTYCIDGSNSRTIYCPSGYSPKSITLAPTDTFAGCQSTHPTKKKDTKKIGVLKKFSDFFPFFSHFILTSIFSAQDMCAAYGPPGPYPTATVESCTSTTVNQRTVTCRTGYWAKGPGQTPNDISIVITGDTLFEGCAREYFFFFNKPQKFYGKLRIFLRKIEKIINFFYSC